MQQDLSWLVERPIAHRGWHGAGRGCENSLPAFHAAAQAGFAIELDVQMSKDGEAMVFHDTTLSRLTDRNGPVDALDANALRDLALPADSGTIPTLWEVHEAVGQTPLVIEVKGDGRDPERLTERVVELVRRMDGPRAVMSFSHDVLAVCERSGLPFGLTAEGRNERSLARHRSIADRAAFLSYHVEDLPNPFVERFRETGRPVITWTVRTREQIVRSHEWADQLTFEGFDPRERTGRTPAA